MICSFLVETICLLFTLWLSRLLLIGVDWMKLLTMNCDDDYSDNNDNNEGNSNNNNNNHNNNNNSHQNNNKTTSSSRPLQGYPFVVLNEDRRDLYDNIPSITNPQIIGGSERDRWGMVGNLDIFLYHLYKYYYNRGYVTLL